MRRFAVLAVEPDDVTFAAMESVAGVLAIRNDLCQGARR
jgi:hypothetical protein